jgi:hypothetical protein
MSGVPEAQLWGKKTYADKARVPIAAHRCQSPETVSSIAHVCKLHELHTGYHTCICGKTWTVSNQAVAS